MKFMIRFFLIALACFVFTSARSQQLHTSSKKALKIFNQALGLFNNHDNDKALMLLQKAIKADDKFIEAYLVMAQIYKENDHPEEAIKNFRKGLSIDPFQNPMGRLSLASYLFELGKYRDAVDEFNGFENSGGDKLMAPDNLADLRQKYDSALELFLNPVPFKPVNLGDSVNSVFNEYWPSLSVDENQMVFTVALPYSSAISSTNQRYQEDFYRIEREKNGPWHKRKNLGYPVNTPENEGAQSISSDGSKIYYTHCRQEIDRGNCNIYFAESLNGHWTNPQPLPFPVNTPYKEKQPSISPDDRILYFSSDRPGGEGGMDIWIALKNADGSWSEPVNAGKAINTKNDEQSPFLHPDGKTLYFSSDGHNGLGGADILYSRMDINGNWSPPQNIGYPVNTNKTEFGLIVNPEGNKAYFASDRAEGRGGLDIYEFDLYENARPSEVSYMKGRVYDAKTYKGLEASFQLYDLNSGKLVIDMKSSPYKGDFLVPLPSDRNYALNVNKEGYLFYSENFSFAGTHEKSDPYLKNIPLKPVGPGAKIVLHNIFFPFNQSEIEDESVIELEKLVLFLNQNPQVKVEISGHTDSIGSEEYNRILSQRRAEAVVLFLIHQGISAERLISKGYGSTEPVAENDTETGRALNRRTEMQIVP